MWPVVGHTRADCVALQGAARRLPICRERIEPQTDRVDLMGS